MGSGVSGIDNYRGTESGSQPYSKSYGVVGEMYDYDVKRGTINNGKYNKNPTANNIKNVINNGYIFDKDFTKNVMYAVDENDNIIIGERDGNKGHNSLPTPHPTLIGGENPKVKIAGMMKIKSGKIKSVNNLSGHYRPNIKSLDVIYKLLSKHKDVLHKNFKGEL